MKLLPQFALVWAILLCTPSAMAQNAKQSFPNSEEHNMICDVLVNNNVKRIKEGFKNSFENFMTTLRDAAKERGIIMSDIALLNTYSHKISCHDTRSKLRHRLPLYKYTVGVGDFDFLLKIVETGNYKSINLNRIETVKGSSETLLDYVNKLMTQTNSRIRYQILRKLKDLLIKSGAKKARDL